MAEKTDKGDQATPRPASSVVLMRECDDHRFEVFFVKRHGKSKFMANAYVFPGGRMDEEDKDAGVALHCRGYLPQDLAARLGTDETDAVGLHIAAFRELFEEAGALLATESDGSTIDLDSPSEEERYDTYREMLQEEEVSFTQIVEWEDLSLRVDELVYFAHWITPEIEKHRYDTRFFLARAPEKQVLVHDDKETTASSWMAPADAIARAQQGEFLLAPPTLHILTDLASYESIDGALAHYRTADIPAVHPHAVLDGGVTLLLPGDPEYPGEAPVPVPGPTRVVLEDGRWWARHAEE